MTAGEPAATRAAHALREDLPRLRGLLHAYAFWAALAAAIVLVVLAPSSPARTTAGIYGAGLCALFAASAIYHRYRGSRRIKAILRRVDHSTIFVFIAASYTPIAVLVLRSPLDVIVLVSVWAGALAGVAFSVAWIEAPRALVAGCYIAIGWVAVVALPQLSGRLGLGPVLLILAGGVLYSLGALAYALQRPNPWPRWFGYHEVFHGLVIAAAVLHFVAIAEVVLRPVSAHA